MSPQKSAKNLVIGHCNMQGGLTGLAKPLEIQDLLNNYGMDILSLNETNLRSTHQLFIYRIIIIILFDVTDQLTMDEGVVEF